MKKNSFIPCIKRVATLLIVTLLTLNNITSLHAEENKHVMDEVVVTSTSKTKMIDTPASISVITAEDLEQLGAKNIIEALEQVPGVFNTSASRSSISIRGTRSSMAGGPLIMVDGVAQKYGSYRNDELEIISVAQIERIEVIRSGGIMGGPGSGRGVINIITKKGKAEKPLQFNFSANYGSWATHNIDTSFNGMLDKWDYFLNYSQFSSNGYEDEEEDHDALLMRFGFNPSDNTRIGFRGNWFAYDRERTDMKDLWELANYRKAKHFPNGDPTGDLVWHSLREQTSGFYAIEMDHSTKNLELDGSISYQIFKETYNDTKDIYTSSRTSRGDIDNSEQNTLFAIFSGSYNFNLSNMDYLLTLGVSYEDVDFNSRRTYPYDTEGTRSTAAYDVDLEESQIGIFWNNDFVFNKNWSLEIGNRIDLIDLKYNNMTPLHLENDDTLWAWSVAPSYHFSENANIYFSVGRNYWYPTPKYFQWAASYDTEGNRPEDLVPEESLTYELGYKHLFNRAFNINATAYFLKQNDKFAGYYESGSFRGMKNMGESETTGIELEIDGRLYSWFGYRLSGSYINAEWQAGTQKVKSYPDNSNIIIDLKGQKVLGVPEFTYHTGLDFYPSKELKISFNINTFGKYYIDYLNRLEYPSKTTVDAKISYSLDKYRFWILGKNILNEEIEKPRNTDGELTEANGIPATTYYVQDGVYVEAGFSVSF